METDRRVLEIAMLEAHDVAEAQNRKLPQFVAALRQRLGKERMELWFGPQVGWQIAAESKLQILVGSAFVSECMQRMFREELRSVVSEVFGDCWGFEFQIAATPPLPVDSSKAACGNSAGNSPVAVRKASRIAYHRGPSGTPPLPPEDPLPVNAIPASKPKPVELDLDVSTSVDSSASGPLRLVRSDATGGPVDQSSTDREIDRLIAIRRQQERRWDEFIVGPHNHLAWTGCNMVLERPGQVGPMLIHGPHGVGKTHLAVALSQRLKSQHRFKRVVFLTGEQFTIEYTENAKSGGFASFRKKYRDVEVLVIDDVQFCLGKTGTLIELRNTIDMLVRESRQVILVSDRGLHQLDGLGHDLHTRLSGGMNCPIEPIDTQTRRALLARMCAQHSLSIDPEVLDWISEQCGADARVIQGIVLRLLAQHRMLGRALNAQEASSAISDIIRANRPIIRLGDIEQAVCKAFGIENQKLQTKSKCQTLSQPRMLAMFLARKHTRTALSEIGEYFGNRTHSTVISAQKKVDGWIDQRETLQVGNTQMLVQDILRSLEVALQVS